MRVVSVSGSPVYRIVTVLLLIAGVIGAHHMVSVTCSAFLNHHGSSHAVEVTNFDRSFGQTSTAYLADTPVDSSGIDSVDSGVHVGLDCLAILIVISIAIPVLRELMNRRKSSIHIHEHVNSEHGQASHPPDLRKLSVSRT